MGVYLVRVDDPEIYKNYTAHSPDVTNKYGGRFIVRGGPVEAIEGAPYNDRLVIVEFPSKEVAEAFSGLECGTALAECYGGGVMDRGIRRLP